MVPIVHTLRVRGYFLDDFRKVSQTIAAMPQMIITAPRLGMDNASPAPRTSSPSPAVLGLMGCLRRSARSVFRIFFVSCSAMAEATFLISSWKATFCSGLRPVPLHEPLDLFFPLLPF